MRVAFVTLWEGSDFGAMERLVAHNKRRYCASHGYDYLVFDSSLDSSRHPYWSKIRAVQRVLPDYDWVVWHDTDAVLWNDMVDLYPYFRCDDIDFVVQEDNNFLNSGVFLLRNCRWSEAFMAEVYDQPHLLNHPLPEQEAMIQLVRRSPWRERSRVLPHTRPQNGFHGFYPYSEWDKLFVHFAGIKNELRLLLIENVARLAGYEKHLRVLERGDFPWLLTRLGLLGHGVEVGAGSGHYASLLLERWNGRKLHLIDPWNDVADYEGPNDEEHEDAYRECMRRTSRWENRVVVHRALSTEAAPSFGDGSLDFVRIDGNPSYEGTCRDIRFWWPKVKPGGLLFGNNFLDGQLVEGDFGVRSAVREFERQNRVAVAVTAERNWASWYAIKPSKTTPNAWHGGHPEASAIQ